MITDYDYPMSGQNKLKILACTSHERGMGFHSGKPDLLWLTEVKDSFGSDYTVQT